MGGIERIAKERQRQLEEEGWDAGHDDQHTDGSLAEAAAYYATGGEYSLWPESWDQEWNKVAEHSRLRQLEIAGALIAAEIDRLERAGAQA